MKTDVATINERQRRSLNQISHQVEMAFASENVSDDVKECLKTIIIEASNESDFPLSDFSLVRAALPNIIENLNFEYGRGVIHAIHAIIQFNTDAFQKFYDDRLDQDTEDLANLLSRVLKHPKMTTRLYNVMADELVETDVDTDSSEHILASLEFQLQREAEVENES
jgi:hypothetical protein